MTTQQPLSPFEALERFRETHPDLATVNQILAMSEERFVHEYAAAFEGDVRKARAAYRAAGELQRHATLLWANIKDAVASPYIQQALFNNIPESFVERQRAIPAYDQLFGSLDFIEVDHCRSIFGPAAYFVDLMRFIEKYIPQNELPDDDAKDSISTAGSNTGVPQDAPPADQADAKPNGVPKGHSLATRQPRLFTTALDCANTSDLVPYIDLVVEVLEDIVRTPEARDAYERIEAMVFPLDMPVHMPLEEIRAYLEQLKLSLAQIYELFGAADHEVAREMLALSPREYNLLAEPIVDRAELSRRYGVADALARGAGTLQDVGVFLEKTRLTRAELNELLFLDLSADEVNIGLARRLFINHTGERLDHIQIKDSGDLKQPDLLLNLSARRLDRIYRFVKLARKLGWRFAELDQALRSLGGSTATERTLRFDGVNDFAAVEDVAGLEASTLTIEAWVMIERPETHPIVCKGDLNSAFTQYMFWITTNGRLAFFTYPHTERNPDTLQLDNPDGALTDADLELIRKHYGVPAGGDMPAKDLDGPIPDLQGLNLTSYRTIPIGAFTHVAVSVNEPHDNKYQLKFYINGALDSTWRLDAPIPIDAAPSDRDALAINIGKNLYDDYFAGSITELRLWGAIRDQAAIARAMLRRCAGNEPGLLACWPLTDRPDQQLLDIAIRRDAAGQALPSRLVSLGGDSNIARPTWIGSDLVLHQPPAPLAPIAWRFNGRDQYLGGHGLRGLEAAELTIEAWVTIEANGPHSLICKGHAGANDSWTEYRLGIDEARHLVLSLSEQPGYLSFGTIQQGTRTHVAVVLAGNQASLYLDGATDSTHHLMAIERQGSDLYIGQDFAGVMLRGQLQDVRIWSRARAADEIARDKDYELLGSEPDLIGYWRLDEPAPWDDPGRPAIDRSSNHNQLFPGGVLATYQPQALAIAERLLPSPAQLEAEVLALGSPDHRLDLLNPAGHSLGYYERFTLQLWFKADQPGVTDRKQLLFSQGDAEIGLSMYLYAGQLYIYAWQTDADTSALLRRAVSSAAVAPARWYQVTFIGDETAPARADDPARPQVVFRAYLDQAELAFEGTGFRLNQNGGARLASLGAGAYARFADGEPGDGSHHLAGRLADLRIWGRALSGDEIAHPDDAFHPRHASPLADDELICYLPLTDGYGWPVNHHDGPRYAPAPGAALEIPRIYDQTANRHDGVFSAGPDDPALKWEPATLPIAPEGPRLPWLTDLTEAAYAALIERDGTAAEVAWAESTTPMTDRPALLLDGDDDRIALPFFRLRDTGTIELWARFIREHDQVLFDASRDNQVEAQRRLFAADVRDSQLHFRVQADDGTIVEAGAIDLAALPARFNLEWHHIAASWQYDPAQQQLTARLFLDGQAGAPAARMPAAAPAALAGLSIGANHGDHPLAASQPLQGQIIQARIWSTARTVDELRALAGATLTGEEAGLLAYLPLDEGQGTLLHNRARYATLQLADPSSAPAHWLPSGAGDPSDLAIDLNPAAPEPKRGQSPLPDALADYIDTPYEIGDEGTIELWFKCQRGRDQVLFDASNDAGGKDGLRKYFALEIRDKKLRFRCEGATDVDYRVEIDLDPSSDPKKPDPLDSFDAQWHHVAVAWRYAPATSRDKPDALLLLDSIYRDNSVEVDAGTARGGRPALLNLFVGKNRGGYERVRNNPFRGQIRQIRLWSRRLNEAEVIAAASAPLTGDESGLQAILLLDEGQGNALRNAALYGTLRLDAAPAPREAWYQPGSRRVLRLDGYELALPRAADLGLAGDFTVEAWVNLPALAGDQPLLATRGPKFEQRPQDFALGVRDGRPYAWLQGQELRADDLQLAANTWHHVAWRYSAGKLNIFLDGAPSQKVFANLAPYTANRLIFAGRRRIWNAAASRWVEGHLDGMIDQLRLWRAARPVDALRRDMLRFLSGGEPDLAAYWRFASGEPQIDDAPVPAPKLSLAATLDGYNDYIDTGELLVAGSAAWTIECWVSRPQAADPQTIFSQRGIFSAMLDQKGFSLIPHAGQPQSWEIDLAPGQWHHLALAYNGTELRLILGGADLGARSATGLALGAGGLLLGANADDRTSAFMRGTPAELRLWSIARTAEQIQADYRRLLSGRESGLEGWWRLDAGPGLALTDSCEILPPAALVAGLENTAEKWAGPKPPIAGAVSALTLDGRDDHVILGSLADLGLDGNFTVEAWVRAEPSGNPVSVAVLGGTQLCLGLRGNSPFAHLGDQDFLATEQVDTQWHQLAWQYQSASKSGESNVLRIFVDGRQVLEQRAQSTSATGPAFLGRYDGGADQSQAQHSFKGQIAEVAIWSDAQLVRPRKQRLLGCEDGLAAYWIFDDRNETIIQSRSSVGTNLYYLVMRSDERITQPLWQHVADLPVVAHALDQYAMVFDGWRHYLAVEHAPLDLGSFTIEAWIGSRHPDGPILWLGSYPHDEPKTDFELCLADGYLALRYHSTGMAELLELVVEAPMQVNRPTHIALVVDRSGAQPGIRLAIDGMTFAIQMSEIAEYAPEATLLVGRSEAAPAKAFQGWIKELRLWRGARSDEQLEAMRCIPIDNPVSASDLLGYWPLAKLGDSSCAPDPMDGAHSSSDAALHTPDCSKSGNDLWLGGLPLDRKPTAQRRGPEVFLDMLKPALTIGALSPDQNQADLPIMRSPARRERSQRTVEIWFRCDDPYAPGRQVVYAEGNSAGALSIAIEAGTLSFAVGTGMTAPVITTNRIEAGRWHHAALILDGRAAPRDDALCAMLDGRVIDTRPAVQLTGPTGELCVGGLRFTPIQVERATLDLASLSKWPWKKADMHIADQLRGQVRELRIWEAARLPEEIRAWPRGFPAGADRTPLLLYFDATELLPPLAGPTLIPNTEALAGAGPRIALDDLAIVVRLKNQYQLPIDKLCALWSEMVHLGTADGSTLYDSIFNPAGTPRQEYWPYWLGQTRVWQVQSDAEPQRRIRGRLMSALRVSSADLDIMIGAIGGANPERVVLDSVYLAQLYRLKLLATMFSMRVGDIASLISLLQEESRDSAAPLNDLATLTIGDIRQLHQRATWLQEAGIDIGEYAFLVQNQVSVRASLPFSLPAVAGMATRLLAQLPQFLVSPTSLADLLEGSEQAATAIYDDLLKGSIRPLRLSPADEATTAASDDQSVEAKRAPALVLQAFTEFGNTKRVASLLSWSASFDGLAIERQRLVKAQLIDDRGMVTADSPKQYNLEALTAIYCQQVADEQAAAAEQPDANPSDGPISAAAPAIAAAATMAIGASVVVARQGDGMNGGSPSSSVAQAHAEAAPADMSTTIPAASEQRKLNNAQQARLALIRDLLAARQSAQQRIPIEITARLVELRRGLNTAIAQLLGDLLDADADLVVAVMTSYANQQLAATHSTSDAPPPQETTEDFLEGMRFVVGEQTLDVGEFLEALAIIAALRSATDGAQDGYSGNVLLVFEYLRRMSKTLFLLGQFDLSRDEAELLLKQPDKFGLRHGSLLDPIQTDLDRLYQFVQIKHALGDENGRLAEALRAGEDGFVARLCGLTGWPETAIRLLADQRGIGGPPNDLLVLGRLQRAFALAETLGTGMQELVALAATDDPSFGFYPRHSAVLFDLLRARYDERQWPQVYRPIHDRLALRKRDSLIAAALEQIAGLLDGRKRLDILYEYLLLDVQMGTETETSRIAQGIASLQLYVERCLMNLEEGVRPEQIPAGEWRWMKSYRVWEANRKVFVYPENYIEPELRDTRTPLFQELMDELQQNDVNADSVTIAFTHYLDKFAEVANLAIVGSYLYTDESAPQQPNATHASTLYLVGRNEKTGELYFRTAGVEDPNPPGTGHRLIWQPWQKIDLTINADFVTPVFAFNRLYLFWAELQESVRTENRVYVGDRKNQVIDKLGHPIETIQEMDQLGHPIDKSAGEHRMRELDENGKEKGGRKARYSPNNEIVDRSGAIQKVNLPFYKPTIKYSFHNFSKSWTPPQALLGPAQGWSIELNERERRTPRWRRVYAQRSLKMLLKNGILKRPDDRLGDVSVLELTAWSPDQPSPARQIPPFDTQRLTLSVLVRAKNLTPLDDDSLKPLTYQPRTCQLLDYARGALRLTLNTRVNERPAWTATAEVYRCSQNTLAAVRPIQVSLANGWNDTSGDPVGAAEELIRAASAVIGTQRDLAQGCEQCAYAAARLRAGATAALEANLESNAANYAKLWSGLAQEANSAAQQAASAAAKAANIAGADTGDIEQAKSEVVQAEVNRRGAQDTLDTNLADLASWQAQAERAQTDEARQAAEEQIDAYAALVEQSRNALKRAQGALNNASATVQRRIASAAASAAGKHTSSTAGHATKSDKASTKAAEAVANKDKPKRELASAEAKLSTDQASLDSKKQEQAAWLEKVKAAQTDKERQEAQAQADACVVEVQQLQEAVNNDQAAIEQAKQAIERLDKQEQDEATTAGSKARAALAEAVQAVDAAVTAITAAYTYEQDNTLKWKPTESSIQLTLGETKVLGSLQDDTWRQVALTLEWQGSGYAIWLYVDDQPAQGSFFFSSGLLPTSEKLVVGLAPGNADESLKICLSELRIWNHLRDHETLAEEMRDRKLGNELGLFHMPLDEPDGTAKGELALTRKYPPIEPPDGERIIIAYGDIAQSLRSNFEDLSWSLKVSRNAFGVPHSGIALQPSQATSATLYSDKTAPSSILAYYVDPDNSSRDGKAGSFPLDRYDLDDKKALLAQPLPEGSALIPAIAGQSRGTLPLIGKLTYQDVRILDIAGRSGWFILDAGDEEFLVTIDTGIVRCRAAEDRLRFEIDTTSDYIPTGSERLAIYLEDDSALLSHDNANPFYRFERLNTFAIHALSDRLFADGIAGLLSLQSQNLEEPDFSKKVLSDTVIAPKNQHPDEKIDNQIDFDGAYGMYYDEIFFHAPLLIANLLNANQRFAEAQSWYHYIFNPVAQEQNSEASTASPNDRYWRFRRFRDLPQTLDELADRLGNPKALDRYAKDPFDPHAIAVLRMNAYQKAVVMKYIDNLIDWGDDLFRQDTRETINEATQLYVLAYTLLGPRPRARKARPFEQIGDFHSVQAKDRASETPSIFLLPNGGPVALPETSHAFNPNIAIDVSFGIIENEQFMAYWDRVEDRLFKIRHSLNIDGVVRSLPLYQPPLDPSALVRAAALGAAGVLGTGTEARSVLVPHYRFEIMLAKAKEFAAMVTSLGAALLVALEKRDAEELTLLAHNHELALLKLTTDLKKLQIEGASYTIEALEQSLASATLNYQRYDEWISENLTPLEIAELSVLSTAKVALSASAVVKVVAGAVGALPQGTAGGAGALASPIATVTTGGEQAHRTINTIAQVLEIGGQIAAGVAEMLGRGAAYERRQREWTLLRDQAGHSMDEITKQIAATRTQLMMAEKDLQLHEKTIEQQRAVGDFYRSKFSNRDLYVWMGSRLSAFYFQAYRMAYDLAKQAEKAYQFEYGTDDTFISAANWDSRRKGLLAGEGLQIDLLRLESAAMAQHKRWLEVEKTISLARLDPQALRQLKTSGSCQFSLDEKLFDRDYPGHYFRIIKSVAISIPAIVGSYQTIHASLTQTGHKTLLKPDSQALPYLLGQSEQIPDSVRVDWRAHQQVAISHGVEDSGLFELNFRDERYLPFENTGAISTWLLDMPFEANLIDFDSISDVIFHLRYMAKSDGGNFRNQVYQQAQLDRYDGQRLFSVAQEFPTEWYAYQNKQTNELVLPLPSGAFPPHVQPNLDTAEIQVSAVLKDGDTAKRLVGDYHIQQATDASNLSIRRDAYWLRLTPNRRLEANDFLVLLTYSGEVKQSKAKSTTDS